MEHRTIELERMKVGVQACLSKNFVLQTDVEMVEYFVTKDLCSRVTQHIMGQQLDVLTISYPATWWQAFKERWFPGFLLRRFPVKRTEHKIDVKAYYPKLALPRDQHHLRIYHKVDGIERWEV